MASERVTKLRAMIGPDYQASARSVENAVNFASDRVLVHARVHTKREKAAIRKAEKKLLEGARILRVVGNRLEGGA
jgi:hypothetical protein